MKKTAKTLVAVVVVTMISAVTFGQQTRQTNLYNYNKFSLNPAYAGASGCTEINFSHINQWVKIEGAPTTSFFNANGRIGKRLGIGGNLLLDRLGMLQQLSASAAVAYGVTIARDHHIRLGLAAGYFQMRLDPSDAIAFDVGDNILDGGQQTANSINTEAGILYQFKGLELSFASKQVLETRSGFGYPNLDGYGLKRHFNAYAGYDILINKKLSLTPNVLFRGIRTSQQFDINVDVNYNDFIYGGLGYRTQAGLVGRLGVSIRKLFFIGYAYEAPMQNIASYGTGSHEVVLGLKFCKKKKEELPGPDDRAEEPHVDTITIVEQVIDTVFIDRVDTIYAEVEPKGITDSEVKRAVLSAEEHLEFKHDQSIIEKDSYTSLESLTNIMLVREDVRIRLEGHTDSDGTEQYNMRLSKNRVEAVKRFLVSNGVDASRIETAHFGESKPIASNATDEGKARNRRVDMIILTK